MKISKGNSFLLLLVSLFFISGFRTIDPKSDEGVKWMTFEEVTAANAKNPRKIFVDIYTDWCGWCKKMDAATFNHPEISKYMNDNFYNVKFNAEQRGEVVFNGHTFKFIANGNRGVHELAVALTNNQLSYPMGIFMDEQMRILSPLPGYQKADFFDAVLKYFAEERHKEMKWDEFYKSYTSQIKN
jgi:thioredoxin-related protein